MDFDFTPMELRTLKETVIGRMELMITASKLPGLSRTERDSFELRAGILSDIMETIKEAELGE